MRVLYEEDVRALLAANPHGQAGACLSCLLDLHLPPKGRWASSPSGSPLAGAAPRSLAADLLAKVAARRARWLDLVLFGGEPLLEIEGVVGLSKALQGACLASGVGYAAHVMTGGALLDAAVARRLVRAGVVRLQVELEAPRRAGAVEGGPGGSREWPRVLDAVAQASSEAKLVLRVSPDPACDLEGLVDALEERGLAAAGPAVALYLARRAPGVQQARELLVISALLEAGVASAARQ